MKHKKLLAGILLSLPMAVFLSALTLKVLANTSTVTPISFTGETIRYSGYMPSIADLNGDGFLDVLGTFNDGDNNLVAVASTTMGLQNLFSPGRVQRDNRIADFNGDGYPDLIANTYSAIDATDSVAMLFLNNGDGTFTEDTQFTQLAIKGYGETILVADFDNDGDVDIYLPYYSHNSPDEHSYLLINDGFGHFVDIADSAGVSLRNRPLTLRPEGAQAVDFNLDGWIDFYVSGHLFRNNGNLTFTDVRAALGLPELFDEGIKFLDWNNDGNLDLVIHHPTTGPALYQFNGATFSLANVIPAYSYDRSYGLNIYDLNNDGREDIYTSGGTLNNTIILLNNGAGFERSNPTQLDSDGNDLIALGDIDRDGRVDVLKRSATLYLKYYRNATSVPKKSFFFLDIVGLNGEQNQQGRIVKIRPQNHPGITFTRIVESGSGYLAQNPYELLVATPFSEPHDVQVYFAGRVVDVVVNPGEKKRVFQDGRVEPYVDANDRITDYDEDGFSNWDEAEAGTDPWNQNSRPWYDWRSAGYRLVIAGVAGGVTTIGSPSYGLISGVAGPGAGSGTTFSYEIEEGLVPQIAVEP